MSRSADRNLLFGLLALQNNFIDRDSLLDAFQRWVNDRSTPLDRILLDRGALTPSRHMLLAGLVAEHITLHGDDPQKSLAALSSIGSVREDLSRIADPELHASLGHVSAARPDDDPFRTVGGASLGAPSALGSRFRVLRPHARGGLGEVFVARDTELNRDVALKEIQDRYADEPRYRSRFEYEAEITGGLEHPGIVPVYGLGHTADGRPFYAMRFIRGNSLKEAIRRFHEAENQPGRAPGQSALELRELLGRFVDVCDAVAYAHSRGVLHRDLKPGNIMLGRYGETLVVDWGLAKALEGPEEEPSATPDAEPRLRPSSGSALEPTQAGSAVGTPGYMSPEQVDRRFGPLGIRSDVYCLGATLYHLLTGHAPCEAEQVGEIYQKILAGEIPRPRSLNLRLAPALEAICLKALASKPSERYATAEALKADVERWLADEPVSAHAEPWTARLRRWSRLHQRLVTGATVACLVAAAALVAITGVISIWNRRLETTNQKLETTNQKLATANQTILQNNDQITRQNQELAESNANLKQARAEVEKERDQAKEVTEFLVSSFRKPDPAQDGKDVKVAEVLGRAVQELEGRANMAPATKAAILSAVGNTYYGLGLYDAAARTLIQAIAVRVTALGHSDPDTLSDRNILAASYLDDGRTAEAIRLLEKSIKLQETKLGSDHSDTLQSRNTLAAAYLAAGRTGDAVTLHEATLKLRVKKLGPDHPHTLNSRDNLAAAYLAAGRTGDAIALIESTLRLFETRLGPDHRDTLICRRNLTNAYIDAGRFPDAIRLGASTLKLMERMLGPDHPDTLNSMNSLANACRAAGQLERAISLHEQALKIKRAKLGDDHPATLTSMSSLATAYRNAGQLDRAIPLHEQALRARRAKLGPDHPDTLTSMNNLAVAYSKAGQLERAISLHEQALKIKRAKLGDDHPATLTSMSNLATAYHDAGQLGLAIPLYEQVLKGRRAKLGDDHPDTFSSMSNLATAYRDMGQVDRAIALQEQTLELKRAKLGEHHHDTLISMNNLATCYNDIGRFDLSIPLCEQVLKARRAKLGEDHPDALISLHNLAAALGHKGQIDRAIPLHEQALKALRAKLGEEHASVLSFQRGFARTYEKAGRYRDAEVLLRKAVEAANRSKPRNDRFYSDSLSLLGRCLIHQGEHAEAIPILGECLEIKEKSQSGDWTTANARSLLGEALAGQRDFPAAELLLLDAQKALTERREKILPRDRDEILRDAIERLARLYEAWGKPDKAEEWRKTLGENALDRGFPADPFAP
jgi:serine/threonine protein kinase